ncbi:hypothetical protein WN51_05504 [Melipona quadrifasciata]|uniref:Uncharacterized protein n=1 Tax=Melipona quadrifasciata TaxID=166423 RepID=A0A0M9AD16_9HYME|nr:hypothetical protein WN51_05504 [Melipona quadrifasciata]
MFNRYNTEWYNAPVSTQKMLLFIAQHCFSHVCIVVVTLTFSMVSVPQIPKENYSCFWQRPVALKRLQKTASIYNPSLILCVATYCLNTFIWGAIELTYLAFSEHVFALFRIVRYNSYWYRMPLKAQKMYLMVLVRSIKSCSFSKGQLFTLSPKGLSTVLNTTFSYITVFYSVQK